MPMNRTATLLLALLFIPFLSGAQQKNPVKLGLWVAPSINWIHTSTEGYSSDGIRGSANLGLVTDFYFAKNYAISTGFSVLFPSGKLTYREVSPDYSYLDSVPAFGTYHSTYKFIYFEIPIMVKMKTNNFGKWSFFGQVGFGTGFRVKATAINDYTGDNGEKREFTPVIDNKTHLMRESILAGIGFEFHIDESTSLFAGANYSNSLNNVFKYTNLMTNQELQGVPNYVELRLGVLF